MSSDSSRHPSTEPSILNIPTHFRAFREAQRQIAELQNRLKEISIRRERKPLQRKIEKLVAEQRRALLKLALGGVGSAAALAGLGTLGYLVLRESGESASPLPPSFRSLAPTPDHEPPPTPPAKTRPIPPPTCTPIQPIQYTSSNHISQMMEMSHYWRNVSLEALGRFSHSHLRVANLLDFMAQKAFYSIPIGPVATQHVEVVESMMEKIRDPHSFEVVYMPEEFARAMSSSILTEPGGKTVRIATNFRCQEWLGIMLAHELSHVEDMLMHRENPHDPSQYFAGEVKAYLFEMDLLKSWSPRTYDFLIERGIPLFQRRDRVGLSKLMDHLYPLDLSQVSPHERSLGSASCLIAIAFEEGHRRGVSDQDLQQIYLQLKNEWQ